MNHPVTVGAHQREVRQSRGARRCLGDGLRVMALNEALSPFPVALPEVEPTHLAGKAAALAQDPRLLLLDQRSAALTASVQGREQAPLLGFAPFVEGGIGQRNGLVGRCQDRGADRLRGLVTAIWSGGEFLLDRAVTLSHRREPDFPLGGVAGIEAAEIHELHVDGVRVAVALAAGDTERDGKAA